jgi:hypothetical protein
MRSDQILHRTIQRVDETVLLEQGRKVERGLWDENTRNSMLTDEQRLCSLLTARVAAGCTFATWNETKDRLAAMKVREGHYTPGGHDIDCPCDHCERGWKRLMYAVGVLPRRHQAMNR